MRVVVGSRTISRLLLLFALAFHPDRAAVHAYNPHPQAFGPGGGTPFRPSSSLGLSAKGSNNHDEAELNKPIISGERASMASRYSNSFSAFGDTVQQPQRPQQYNSNHASAAVPSQSAQLVETAPRPDDDDMDDDSLGAEQAASTAANSMDMSTIRVVTRRGGVQKPPGYVGKTKIKTKTKTKALAKPITNHQQTSGKADKRPPSSRTNQAATTAAKPPQTKSASSKSSSSPRPVISGERASMAARYANSFSPYGSTAPAPEGPAPSSRARRLVGQMAAATGSAGSDSRGGGGGGPASGGANAADGMRPVISGDRASMDNRYSNSLSAFGDTAPAPPTIVQQQRAAKRSSARTPRVEAANASGGKARVGKTSTAPPKPPRQQAAAVDDPNRPVISGDRASLDNRYSNSFSPFTNVGGGGRKPTDGPFPSVVQPPPSMPKAADVISSSAAELPVIPTIGSSGGRGRAEAKRRKPMIIPRAEAPQTPSTYDSELDDEMVVEETMAGKSTPATTASVGSVTHNGDRAGNRNQNSFSAFGDTPVAPVIGGARTDDRYGNSFDASGNEKPQPFDVASSSPSKARPIPPAAVMNGDRAGGRNQNSFSAFGDTPAPGAMGKEAKPDIDAVTPPKEVAPRTTTTTSTATTTQSKPQTPVDNKPQVEAPKAILGGARVENIYGNSLSAFGDVDPTKMKPRRKPAARFASPNSKAGQKKKTGSDKEATSTGANKKEVPKAIMNGARGDDIYFNSFSAFGADVTKTPKAKPPRRASRPAKRIPAAYTGNPDINVSQDSGISGSSASNEHDRYGNAHHVYNSHVHALNHQEPIEDDEDGRIITKKERKWIIP